MKGVLALLVFLVMSFGVYLYVFGQKEELELVAQSAVNVKSSQATLKLLHERKAPVKKIVSSNKPRNADSTCVAIGAFASGAAAQNVISRLTAVDIGSSINSVAVEGVPDFWVYMPPLPDRRSALEKIRELQGQGIDSFIITQGELENGISLGLFSQRYRAIKVQKDIVGKGYAVEVREVPRPQKEYWVIISAESRPLFGEDIWREIESANEGIKRRLNRC